MTLSTMRSRSSEYDSILEECTSSSEGNNLEVRSLIYVKNEESVTYSEYVSYNYLRRCPTKARIQFFIFTVLCVTFLYLTSDAILKNSIAAIEDTNSNRNNDKEKSIPFLSSISKSFSNINIFDKYLHGNDSSTQPSNNDKNREILSKQHNKVEHNIKEETKSVTTDTKLDESKIKNSIHIPTGLPMPNGVNFGSWLALEDYFFVGPTGAVEVATPDDKIAAKCLPPLHTGEGPTWQSETDLFMNLINEIGIAKALKVFHAHRTSFIDFDTDLALLQSLGITNIRVPMSWCFTDMDPSDIDTRFTNESMYLTEHYTCQDPFYEDIYWVAIPKSLIINLLTACAKYNITAVLDLHTYPGATSIGTFSGLWPKWPRFWLDGDKPENNNISNDIGRKLFSDFVVWIESLSQSDPIAFSGLRGLSSMNEPAHLAGLYGPGASTHPKERSFLPDLPESIAQSFLQVLNNPKIDSSTSTSTSSSSNVTNYTKIPNGPHLRVLLWLSDSVQIFRSSNLPKLGKELHVNIHESIFHPSVLPIKKFGIEKAAIQVIASWWRAITDATERASWLLLDNHHYHAWNPDCQGTFEGKPLGSYMCGDTNQREKVLTNCTSWATNVYRKAIDEECGPGSRLVSAEFSASTHHLAKHACTDLSTLRSTYTKQIEAAISANVELFWWSFKMPYGGSFRPSWSFKHFLFLMGVLPQADEPIYDCGQHVPNRDEPLDPIFHGKLL